MKHPLMTLALVSVLLGFAGPLAAQEDYEEGSAHNYALGIGGGLVDPAGPTEPYYTANLRIRLGSHSRSREDLQRQGIHGFIEPEIGYWSRDSGNSDLLVGANLIGLVPFHRVNYSFGVGAGLHFLDYTVQSGSTLLDESDTAVGVNAQFGIDILMTDAVGSRWQRDRALLRRATDGVGRADQRGDDGQAPELRLTDAPPARSLAAR